MTGTPTPPKDRHRPTPPYEELATELRGALVRPGEPTYDQARAVYNGMIDRRPAAIARCADVADVVACVRFAGEHGVDLAVRGGGHNAAGVRPTRSRPRPAPRRCAGPS